MRAVVLGLALLAAGCEWEGRSQFGTVPADPSIAVSPRFFVQATNGGIRVWDRPYLQTRLLGFPQSMCVSNDMRIYYDAGIDRWYLVSNHPVGMCLAVSQTNDPTGPWWQYFLENPGGDHPTLAWSNLSLVVVEALGQRAYVLDKIGAYQGIPTVFQWFTQTNLAHAAHPGAVPAGNWAYVVETDGAFQGLWLWRFSGVFPGGTVHRTHVDTFGFGDSGVPVQGAFRIFAPFALMDAHISADSNRLYVAVDDAPASVRVFEFRGVDNPWGPYRHSSTRYDGPGHMYFGSIGEDDAGIVWVGATCSSITLPLSMCLSWRAPGFDGIRAMEIVKAGTAMYTVPGGLDQSGGRAGDFTTLAQDPLSPKFLYFTGQVALEAANWRTWIMSIGRSCTLNPRRCT